MTDARGQDPFSSYIEHQMEMIVLLACGEKMTTLGGATGLGSNLADVQSQEFNNLVNYDCKRIANSMTRCAVRKCVKKLFPGKDLLCKFAFVEQDNTTAEQYIALAKQLKEMGVAVDISKLKELTGLALIADDQADVWQPINKDLSENE